MHLPPDRASTAAPRRRRWPGRLALLLAALVGVLAAAEIGLRLTYRGDVRRALESRRRELAPDAQTVLCVGDSYTFGLYYRPEESYPGRLEQLLCALTPPRADGRAGWFVENGGIPAQNTAQMAARLDEQLARLALAGGAADGSRLAEFREDRIALPGRDGAGGVAIDIRKTGQRLDDADHQALVEARLRELVVRIRAAGTTSC